MFGSPSKLSATITPIGSSGLSTYPQLTRQYSGAARSFVVFVKSFREHVSAIIDENIYTKIKTSILPPSLREHASAVISGNYIKKGSYRCTALRSRIGAWFDRLLGGCRQYKNTHGLANIFAITTWSSNEQTDMIPQVSSTNEIFDWAYGTFKYKRNYRLNTML
jgi:hypothetical protein